MERGETEDVLTSAGTINSISVLFEISLRPLLQLDSFPHRPPSSNVHSICDTHCVVAWMRTPSSSLFFCPFWFLDDSTFPERFHALRDPPPRKNQTFLLYSQKKESQVERPEQDNVMTLSDIQAFPPCPFFPLILSNLQPHIHLYYLLFVLPYSSPPLH